MPFAFHVDSLKTIYGDLQNPRTGNVTRSLSDL